MALVPWVLLIAQGCGEIPQRWNGSDDSTARRISQTDLRGSEDGSNGRILARVGEDTITQGELRDRILDRYYGVRALNGLVRESLFIAESERLGMRIDPAEIASRVEQELDQILGDSFEQRRVSRIRLEQQGLLERDLRREIAMEVGPALLIQMVISAHREIEEEQILDLWRETWKEPRRLIEHIVFPLGDADDQERQSIERWANLTAKALESGTAMESAVEQPIGLRSSFTPKIGGGWVRESDLSGSPIFFEVFQVEVGKVLGPILEDNFGWHLFRVVETRPIRSYSEVREDLLKELRDLPATDEEILDVERKIRRRIPVFIESNPFRSGADPSRGDR
ncbi:MAG TPA: peptidyl-prolyl cis-trans isomerase [Planctomycetes bacterium]|nr:peptidyl-prolyl cis-trans isomerase [Planctomycetota bacterium]